MNAPTAHTANQTRASIGVLILIAGFWLTNLIAIDRFPPFIDEMIHVHGSEQVFTQSPLANANLGRQFTIWWMAVFQAYQGSPFWISRVVTVLAGILGMAAAIGIGRTLGGLWGAILTALLFQFSAYHYFFGRLALADPIGAAAVVLAIYFGLRLSRRWHWIDAVLTGACLFLAVGAKVSTLPYLG
ncbi:MAG: glycosyltransferase family 39 protein, partial [Anaerolineae bacterium]|nr:glycosyltransferase family 39 protein [Anaerolineae bacterium]